MHSLTKLFNHLCIEGWDVGGLSARDQTVIRHYFFVHPVGTRIDQISFERGSRGHRLP